MSFTSVEQRVVYSFLETFPPFFAAVNGPGSQAQKQFYRFMKELYEMLAQRPDLLVTQLHPDDAHTNRFNKGADHKPKLREWMRKMQKEVDALIAAMFSIGAAASLRGGALLVERTVTPLKKKHRLALEQMGIRFTQVSDGSQSLAHPQYPGILATWQWLATRPGASTLAFSRCFFDPDYLYASDIYAGLLKDDQAFRRLEAHLRAHGYTAIINDSGEIALDYLNLRGETAKPKCGFPYRVQFTGISARYDFLVKSPPVLGLCIPCMKNLLTRFESLPPVVKSFMAERTRRCSNCGYCIQTDKSGNRARARIPVEHDGKMLQLCPYFPGYDYCWTELNDQLVDNLIAMLDAMDRSAAVG